MLLGCVGCFQPAYRAQLISKRPRSGGRPDDPPAGDPPACSQRLRIDSIRAAAAANSGVHPTSSMSAADLMAVLMARHLRYDYDAARRTRWNNDHLIFSKGHASPLVYAMFAAAGAITDEELLTFRRFGSKLEGHPTPILPWVDVATGSLGQGMPIAAGVALCARDLDRLPYRVFTLCGDSEMAEGSIWEAVEHAGVNDTERQLRGHHRRQPPGPGAGRRCTAGTLRSPSRQARRGLPAGTRSRSTATTSPRSTAPSPRPRRRLRQADP